MTRRLKLLLILQTIILIAGLSVTANHDYERLDQSTNDDAPTNERVNDAQAILNILAKSSSTISSTTTLEFEKLQNLSAHDAEILRAIREALENDEVPNVFGLKSYLGKSFQNYFYDGVAGGALCVAAGCAIVGGVLAIVLFPVGLAMGLPEHPVCPPGAEMTGAYCTNEGGLAIPAAIDYFHNVYEECPESYSRFHSAPDKVCITDYVATPAPWEYDVGQTALSATLGAIGGTSILCFLSAGCSLVTAGVSSLWQKCRNAYSQETTPKKIHDASLLYQAFPQFIEAINYIIEKHGGATLKSECAV